MPRPHYSTGRSRGALFGDLSLDDVLADIRRRDDR
jgi:hypothetical protein